MKKQTRRAIVTLAIYIVMLALFGALIAICNQWLRINGGVSRTLMVLLVVGAVAGNYWLWRRLCRRLDSIDNKEQE